MSSALKKDIVKRETSELDCMEVAEEKPNNVLFCKTVSSVHHVKALKPCSKNFIQNKNTATPADISLNSGLIQNQYTSIVNIVGKNILLNIINS